MLPRRSWKLSPRQVVGGGGMESFQWVFPTEVVRSSFRPKLSCVFFPCIFPPGKLSGGPWLTRIFRGGLIFLTIDLESHNALFFLTPPSQMVDQEPAMAITACFFFQDGTRESLRCAFCSTQRIRLTPVPLLKGFFLGCWCDAGTGG